jgi:AraC-like DNA-binding protein
MDYAVAPSPARTLDAALADSVGSTRFETNEPSFAVKQLTGVYGPHSLRLPADAPLQMSVRSFELAQLDVAQIRYGPEVVASMSQMHPRWMFSYICSGTARVRVHSGPYASDAHEPYTPGTAGVNSPDTLADVVLSADMQLVNLCVTEADMRAACGALLGAEHAQSLCFRQRAAPGSDPARVLTRIIGHLADATRYAHPAARRFEFTLRDAALYELLLGWPNSAALAAHGDAALPISTRRAREYIHAHAAEVPTVAEIAAAAGVGVRALALGFEKHFGLSPLRYLQQQRLDGVRAQLLSGGAGESVTRVALDWGFANLGVFAARYRARFGESPRETLRRHGPH